MTDDQFRILESLANDGPTKIKGFNVGWPVSELAHGGWVKADVVFPEGEPATMLSITSEGRAAYEAEAEMRRAGKWYNRIVRFLGRGANVAISAVVSTAVSVPVASFVARSCARTTATGIVEQLIRSDVENGEQRTEDEERAGEPSQSDEYRSRGLEQSNGSDAEQGGKNLNDHPASNADLTDVAVDDRKGNDGAKESKGDSK